MKRKDVILLAVAIMCLGGAALFATRAMTGPGRQSADFPDGTFWICQACKHEFVKSVDEVMEIKTAGRESPDPAAGQMKCPSCGAGNTVRGLRCPSCKRIFVRSGAGRPTCPYCNMSLPAVAEGPGG